MSSGLMEYVDDFDCNTKIHCTVSDLHVAIYSKNDRLVKQCVKNKAIINSFWRGSTPVSSALYLKRYHILHILVTNGANVNLCTRNNKMEPPLFAACRLRDRTAIDILLTSADLRIDQQDFFGRTALYAAARYSNADIVEILLNRGAKLNANYDCYKKHPFYGALQHTGKDAKGVIELLIRRGSLLEFACEESPLKWAVDHGESETFCLLVSAGCKVKCYDWLLYDKLPEIWQKDKNFCTWIDSIQNNPPSLCNITACCIRNALSKKWSSLQAYHVKQLQLPDSLSYLILLM